LFGQEPFYTFNENAYMGDSLEQPSVAVSSDGTRIAWTANESHSRSVLMREPYSGVNVQACATTTEYFWWIPQDELNPSSASPGKVLPGWKFIGDNPWEVMPPIAIIPQDSAVPPGRSASSPGTDGECDFEIKLEKSLFAVNEPVRMNFTLKCKAQRGLWLNPPLSSKGLVRGTVLTPAFSVPLTTWLSNPNEDTKPVFLENGKTLERSLTVIPKGTGEHVIMASYFSTEQSETYAKAPVVHFTVGDGVCAETDSERFTNLLDRLRDAPNRKAQSEVANTIVLLGLDAIPYIQKTIQDEPGEQQPEHPSLDSVRFKLYEAWVLIGEESLIPFTRERLKTCNEQEQLVIIDILTQLYTDPRCGRKPQKQRNPAISSQALEIVFSLTSAGSPSVSRHAIVCLRNQHTPEVEAFFLKMLSDDDPAIRGAALENRMHSLINQDRGYDAEVQALLNPIIDNPEFDTIALNYFELLFASKSYVYDGAAEELFVRFLKRHGAFAYDSARRVYQNRKDIPLDEWLANIGKNPTQKEFLRLQEVIADFAAHSKGDKPALFAEDWDSIQNNPKAQEAFRKNLESWIEYARKHPKYPPLTSRAHSVEK
jgi:hypothetical protein